MNHIIFQIYIFLSQNNISLITTLDHSTHSQFTNLEKIFPKIFPFQDFSMLLFQTVNPSQFLNLAAPNHQVHFLAYHFPSETHSLFSPSLSLSSQPMEEARKKRSERMEVVQATQGIKREERDPSPLRLEWRKSEKGEERTEEENGDERRTTSGSRRFQ